MKRIIIITIASMLLFGCYGSRDSRLTIFHAGSLSYPLKQMVDSFIVYHPEISINLEASGSVDAARKITELKRECDIMASADYRIIEQLLIPNFADSSINFASNSMAIVYTPKSKYSDEINRDNWIDILSKNEVYIGRSDPNADPCGYRSLIVLDLAKRSNFHNKAKVVAIDKILNKEKTFIRPKEVDLLALLDAGAVDYIFLYKSVAVQHKLNYLELNDSISLRNPNLNDFYRGSSVVIRGGAPKDSITIYGEAMIYGLTILKNAPNKVVAEAFVNFIRSPKGKEILRKSGQEAL